jgi:amidase
MCGLFGLKPTRGRCSFGPGLGERWSGFSAEFAVTRSVRDAATLLDAVAGPMPGDPYFAPPPARPFRDEVGAPPGRLRVGVMKRAPRGDVVHADALATVEKTAQLLGEMGHVVEESYPEALDDPMSVMTYVTIVSTNTGRALDAWGDKVGRPVQQGDVEPLTWALAERGRGTSAPELLAAVEFVHAFGRRLAAWWGSGFDVLLTPTQGAPPPEIGWISSTEDEPLRAFIRSAPYGTFTLPWNMSGQPAVSLPVHWTADGLPMGVQAVAGYGREDILLRLGAQLEEAVGWTRRRPALVG